MTKIKRKNSFFQFYNSMVLTKKNDKKYKFLIKITILVPKKSIIAERPSACKRLKKIKNVKKGF